nr:MAG TPA: hypothetical protein [Caudoviricetes sp.]
MLLCKLKHIVFNEFSKNGNDFHYQLGLLFMLFFITLPFCF